MQKSYAEFMNEITAEKLYEGLLAYGLFAEKLPPIFTTKPFYDYCLSKQHNFQMKRAEWITFDNCRNTNVPRTFGIPNPMQYQLLCEYLKNNWDQLKRHFAKNTSKDKYIVSRIHIRKMEKTKALFVMNYKKWPIDGSPEPDLLIGKRYIVKADISNCFPSIYTHAISWALVGKDEAKGNQKGKKKWYNELDTYVRNCKYGETHGILIGPHASNILSEVILTAIDEKLRSERWPYTRNIDDYLCYTESREDAEQFLVELDKQLKYYDLSLNQKKVSIGKLPIAAGEQWVRKLNALNIVEKNQQINYTAVRAFLDSAVEIMRENGWNASVLYYAIKLLSQKDLKESAKEYCLKTIFHLTLLFPYLVTILEEHVFSVFGATKEQIALISSKLYANGIKKANFEEAYYAVYFAIKYGFTIEKMEYDDALQSDSCIFLLLSYLYYKKYDNQSAVSEFCAYAQDLSKNDFNRFWLFVYEVLDVGSIIGDWKSLKGAGVSFISEEFWKFCKVN